MLAAYLGQRASWGYLALLVGGMGFLLLLQNPGLTLVAMAGLSFTLPFTFGTGSEVALTPPVLLIPVVVVVWLLDGLRQGEVRTPASRTILPLILFTSSGLLSLVAGNIFWDPQVPRPDNLLLVQLAQWAIYALSAAIFVAAGALGTLDSGQWQRSATWLFLGLAAVVVLEHYIPPLYRILPWATPSMADRSMFWTWLPALAAGQLLFNRRLDRRVRVGLLVLLLVSAFYIIFRQRTWVSGWVPFGVALLAVVCLWVWRRSRPAALVLGVGMIVLAVVLYPVFFAHAGGERELAVSWGGRKLLYQAVFDLVKEHPILGLGPASYRHYGHATWLSMGAGRALWTRPDISSHNNFIDVYAQQGLVGLVFFLWFLVELGLLCRRLAPRFKGDFREGYIYGAMGGLAGSLVAMMLADWLLPFVYNVGFSGFRTSALAWMFMGGLVALEQISRRQARAGGGEP
jgi:O-antigen ligase